ncbi:MAG: YfhO family protein, partial [Atopobiaceae bacterium]|nr:YfhO family protein [Atopobiaceae bacterium]
LLSLAPLPSQTNDVSIIFAALLLCSSYFALMTTTLNGDATHPNSTLIAVVLLSAAFASFSVCSVAPMGGDDVAQFFKPVGGAYDFYYADNPFQAMDTLPKEERRSYRYSYPDRDVFSYRLNDSLIHDRSGLSSYTSLYNQSINDFRDEMGLSESSFSAIMIGSNSRLALEAFAGAKYFFANQDNAWLVPATYAAVGEGNDTGSQLYQTKYALPAGFVYKNTIDRDVYNGLSMIEKQEALLGGCVLENANPSSSTLSSSDLDITSVRLPFTHNAEEGIRLEEGKITVSERGSKLTLSFDGLADSETYLTLSNLQYVPEDPSLSGAKSIEDSIYILSKGYYPSSFTFSVSSELGKTSVLSYTPMDFRYCGRSDWAVNTGYSKDGLSELTLTFDRAGTYTFDDLSVVCQPIEPIKNKLSVLQSGGLSNIIQGNNQITAVAHTTSEVEYALLTTAYSPGWSATVDGQEAKVLKGDTGFIALELIGSGTHEICLTYRSPGLKSGAILTVGSAAALVLIEFAKRHRKDH